MKRRLGLLSKEYIISIGASQFYVTCRAYAEPLHQLLTRGDMSQAVAELLHRTTKALLTESHIQLWLIIVAAIMLKIGSEMGGNDLMKGAEVVDDRELLARRNVVLLTAKVSPEQLA